MEPFNAIRGVVYVMKNIYEIALLSRDLPGPYHCLYINSFYKDDLLKCGNTKKGIKRRTERAE